MFVRVVSFGQNDVTCSLNVIEHYVFHCATRTKSKDIVKCETEDLQEGFIY